MACKYMDTDLTVEQQQQEMVLVIGENIKVRRFARFADGVSAWPMSTPAARSACW